VTAEKKRKKVMAGKCGRRWCVVFGLTGFVGLLQLWPLTLVVNKLLSEPVLAVVALRGEEGGEGLQPGSRLPIAPSGVVS